MKLETFFEKFELFADAPDSVARMRRFILDLAVQGKLVAQDAKDEPADELLKRVQAEKARLVKSGVIKKQEQLPPVSEDAIPFSLPAGWAASQLGDVAVCLDYMREPINGTERDLRIAGKSQDHLFPYYGATQQQGWIDDFIFDAELVLLGEDGVPFFDALRSKAYLISGKTWVNNHAHVFRGILVSNLFVMHWLNTFDYTGRVAGSTRSKLNQAKAIDIPIALPPLAEQKRIVAKVDELMALCDRLEAQQQEREEQASQLARASLARFADAPTPANLHFLFHPSYAIPPADLRKSILTLAVQGKLVPQDPNDEPASESVRRLQSDRRDLFEAEVIRTNGEGIRPPRPPRNGFVPHVDADNQDVPFNWCVTRVGDVSECLDYLRVPVNKGQRLAAIGTVPYYGANGQVGWIDKHLFDEDLVLVVEDETFIGRIKPFSYVIRGKSWVNNHAHVLRPLGGMTADFLNLVLCRYPFIPLTSGTTNRRKLTQPSLMEAKIPLPPLAEQRRIVAKVEQLMALVDALETQLAASRATAENLLTALVAELTTS